MEKKAYVVTPEQFGDVLKSFLEKLKEKNIVDSYSVNKKERIVMVRFKDDIDIPETKEDLITKGVFKNIKRILKDIGVEDIDDKMVTLPMFSTQENEGNVVVNY